MEMSNSFDLPELHVAQQRRRDKLRFQPITNYNNTNTTHNNDRNINVGSPMMLLSPEMFNYAVAATPQPPLPSSHHHHLANIHPTRFVAPSSPDSQSQTLPLNWVQSIMHNNQVDFRTSHNYYHDHDVDDNTPEIGYQNNWGPSGINNNNNNNSSSSDYNELPLLPGNFDPSSYGGGHGGGLSLSLSSSGLIHHTGDQRELKPLESGTISSSVEQDHNNVVGGGGSSSSSIQVHTNVGPLGPFTGYTAILTSSKFLRPAQHLLDELFGVAAAAAAGWRAGGDEDSETDLIGSKSFRGGSSSNDLIGWSDSSYLPGCHQSKAKLLHMQQEVCKRQKQYHQQMQMVLSAFESVPGLSNATPYISSSLKTISRHFRSLKNAIADQLRHIKRALGEDISSPTSFLKGDGSSSLRYDRSFAKIKSSGVGGTGQNHVWRPQRGLPERAVSVLRAWLFEHFLHPYPTDNDKQMLATQTGLTRNQVSNWFINARVRLWKPMVEEIHTLETKDSSSRSEPGSSNNSPMPMPTVAPKNRQVTAGNKFSSCKPPLSPACDIKQLEYSSNSRERSRGREANTEQLFQKCSRMENQHHRAPENMDSSSPYLRFLPYQSSRQGGLELGDIGVVSLTLGLRHGSDATQQQFQQQFVPQGIPFGGHVIHDFSA